MGVSLSDGRAVAQAVSRRLPTAAARVPTQVTSCDIFDGRSLTATDSLQVLGFSSHSFIPMIALASSSQIN
jgi:hypothetical protein